MSDFGLNENGQACLILNALPRVGPILIRRLWDYFSEDLTQVFASSSQCLCSVEGLGPQVASSILSWHKHFDLDRELRLLEREDVRCVFFWQQENYPSSLASIYDPPPVLYLKGRLPLASAWVSIVGTRQPSVYGRRMATHLASCLGKAGVPVVSGLARGIDTVAHRACLENEGHTIAVLGNGLGHIYPPENRGLYEEISEKGCLLSEFPLMMRADKLTFPRRNRIVAGLSKATVVVESGSHGGSMITARFAGEYGRDLLAVPGRLDEGQAAGCHALIRDGADIFISVDDLLERLQGRIQVEFGFPCPPVVSKKSDPLLECFVESTALHPDVLAERLQCSSADIMEKLLFLELEGVLRRRVDGCYELS